MRRFADFLLLGVTSGELVLLLLITPTFAIADWIYVSQHLVVLGIALARPAPKAQDRRTARCPPAPPSSCHMPIHTLSSRTCDGCPATEFRHGPPGDRGMGIPGLPHSRRGADPRSRYRVAELPHRRALPSPPRPVVVAVAPRHCVSLLPPATAGGSGLLSLIGSGNTHDRLPASSPKRGPIDLNIGPAAIGFLEPKGPRGSRLAAGTGFKDSVK